MRSSPLRHGIFSVILAEARKLPAHLAFRGRKRINDSVQFAKFVTGEDVYIDEKTRDARKRHKEFYDQIMSKNEENEKERIRKATAGMSFYRKALFYSKENLHGLKNLTSVKSGKMALLQHCTVSHAAEVAMEQNIDVKDVQMILEKRKCQNAVGYEEVVVGLIDAPNASPEEVQVFAQALQKACPMARQMQVDWRSSSSDVPSEREAPEEISSERRSTSATDTIQGTPGAHRAAPTLNASHDTVSAPAFGSGDELNLPGVQKRNKSNGSAINPEA